jgi:hypothetical protein
MAQFAEAGASLRPLAAEVIIQLGENMLKATQGPTG